MFTELPTFAQIVVPLVADISLLILLLALLMIDLFTKSTRKVTGYVAGVGMFVIMALTIVVGFSTVGDPQFDEVLGGMIRHDMLTVMFAAMILLAGGLTCFIALDSPKIARVGEFYAILTAAVMGMTLMAAAADLIMVFLALETASISLYMLAGFLRSDERSTEAGIKYYLFGAATSGVFLYGLSLLYGFTGKTNIYALAEPLSAMMSSGEGIFALVIALLLLLVGFGFKIAVVPFHFWTPDVYQGAPTAVTAFISTASKAASFALLLRVFAIVWPAGAVEFWVALLAAIAAITMTVGNLLALVQTNIKRMLAYSSIAQAGYTLIGVITVTQTNLGAAAVAFYMLMYTLTNIMAFTVIITLSNATGSDEIKDFANMGRRSPYLALAMVLAFLSLGGVPPLAGFFGKFFLFAAAVESGYTWLALVGVLNAIVALYYYLTVIKIMYVDPNEDDRPLVVTPNSRFVLWVTGIGILLMGTIAAPFWTWALDAASSLTAMLP